MEKRDELGARRGRDPNATAPATGSTRTADASTTGDWLRGSAGAQHARISPEKAKDGVRELGQMKIHSHDTRITSVSEPVVRFYVNNRN